MSGSEPRQCWLSEPRQAGLKRERKARFIWISDWVRISHVRILPSLAKSREKDSVELEDRSRENVGGQTHANEGVRIPTNSARIQRERFGLFEDLT